jgi:hypothetical protein
MLEFMKFSELRHLDGVLYVLPFNNQNRWQYNLSLDDEIANTAFPD